VVAVGFGGGFAGGLLALWVEAAGHKWFQRAVREGVQYILKHGTMELEEGAIHKLKKEKEEAEKSNQSAFQPVVPETFKVYLEKKSQLDHCFSLFNVFVTELQEESDRQGWSQKTGWALHRHITKNWPVFTDAPDPRDLPDQKLIAKASELLMWVLWADNRDYKNFWDKWYKVLDDHPGRGSRDIDLLTGEQYQSRMGPNWGLALRYAGQLAPVFERLQILDKGPHVQSFVWNVYAPLYSLREIERRTFLDLRKLRKLDVGAMANLPFGEMKTGDLPNLKEFHGRGKYLESLSHLQPAYKRNKRPK
jgi:hypothetical protein